MEDRRARIEALLRERLDARHVEVVDESHLHVGHPGAASGGGHFRAVIVADCFAGLSRLESQRRVYAALGDAMGSDIHAFSMTTYAPEDWEPTATRTQPEGEGP